MADQLKRQRPGKMQRRIMGWADTKNKLNLQITAKQEQILNLEAKCKEKDNSLRVLARKHKVELDKSAAQIDKLNETIQGLREQIDNAKKEKVAMGNDHSLKLEEVNKSIEQLKIINEELNTVKKEMIKVLRKNNLKDLEKVNEKLNAEKEEVLKLEYKCKEKDKSLRVLARKHKVELDESAAQIDKLNETIQGLREQIDNVKKEKVAMGNDHSLKLEEVNKSIEQLKIINEELTTVKEEHIKAVEVLRKNNLKDLEKVNEKLNAEKEEVLKLEYKCKEKDNLLAENKNHINGLANHIFELESTVEVKEGLEKEVSKLTTELENLKHSCDYFENEYKGLQFSIEMQEKSYTNTIGKLKEQINSLEKDLLEKNSLELDGLKETTTKLEDEIASLKNTVEAKNNEIEDLKKTVKDARKSRTENSKTPLKNEKKTGGSGHLPPITASTPKRLSNRLRSRNKALAVSVTPIVRSKPKSNTAVKPALPLFTSSDDTDSDKPCNSSRKRVSFSPNISTDIELEALIPTPPTAAKKQCLRSQDKTSSVKKNATCYAKPRGTLPKSTFGTRKKVGEENRDDLRWTDDVFKFNGD